MAMNDPIADMLTRIRNATRNHVKDWPGPQQQGLPRYRVDP